MSARSVAVSLGIEQHLRHRLDARGVDLVELVHVVQDAVEIGANFATSASVSFEIRQIGHVPNFFFRNLHASAFLRAAR